MMIPLYAFVLFSVFVVIALWIAKIVIQAVLEDRKAIRLHPMRQSDGSVIYVPTFSGCPGTISAPGSGGSCGDGGGGGD